jgi:hypothetical protein
VNIRNVEMSSIVSISARIGRSMTMPKRKYLVSMGWQVVVEADNEQEAVEIAGEAWDGCDASEDKCYLTPKLLPKNSKAEAWNAETEDV